MSKTAALIWYSPDEDTPPEGKIVLVASKNRTKTDWVYTLATFRPEGDDDEGDWQDEMWEDASGGIEIDTPDFWAHIHAPEAIQSGEDQSAG